MINFIKRIERRQTMNKESLQKIRTKLIEVISNSNINSLDKTELLINLYHLLDVKNYDEAIKTLIKTNKK